MAPWSEADTVLFEPLGGREMLTLLTNARSFDSEHKEIKMPDKETLVLRRASFLLPPNRLFMFTYATYRGLSCISFEDRPAPNTFRGRLLSILMVFRPSTPLLRKSYVLPCPPSDLSPHDFKKVFKMLTGLDLNLW